jgi:hypothetical protein
MGRAARYEATPIRHARDLRLEAPWVWWRRQRTRLGTEVIGLQRALRQVGEQRRASGAASTTIAKLKAAYKGKPGGLLQPLHAGRSRPIGPHYRDHEHRHPGIGVAEIRVDRIELFP